MLFVDNNRDRLHDKGLLLHCHDAPWSSMIPPINTHLINMGKEIYGIPIQANTAVEPLITLDLSILLLVC